LISQGNLVKFVYQVYLRGEQEPLSQRVTEEDEAHEFDWVMWPVGDDKAEHQTCVKGYEVVGNLSDKQQRKNTESFVESSLATRRAGP